MESKRDIIPGDPGTHQVTDNQLKELKERRGAFFKTAPGVKEELRIMLRHEIERTKKILVLELSLHEMYIRAGDPRALTLLGELIDAARNEGAMRERHKQTNGV